MRSRCSPDRGQEGKDTFFFDFGGRFLDRWCSSRLVLFPSAIYSCQGDLKTCFTCIHQSKAGQNSPRGVANLRYGPWPSNMHSAWCLATRQPASPACRSTQTTVCDFYCRFEVRTNAPAFVTLVNRILFLLFWERRRNRQSSSRS